MKPVNSTILKIIFLLVFVLASLYSFEQTKGKGSTTAKQSANNKGTIIISADKACIITINGTQIDVLNEKEIKSIKYPIGNVLLKGEMTFDNSVYILKEITVTKDNNTIVVLDFGKELEVKKGVIKETNIQIAVANYKSTLLSAECRSSLLESQLNTVQTLNYSLIKQCNTCSGKGQVTNQKECSACGGTALLDCSYCINGVASCSNCKGVGKVRCTCAYETVSDVLFKRHHYNPYCNVCGGNAGGKGELNCSVCIGSGKTTCSYCQGNGEKKCGYCKNGYINSKQCCDECKGMGRVVE